MGRVKKKNNTSLSKLYLRNLGAMLGTIIVWCFILFALFDVMMVVGWLYPANYGELQATAVCEEIANTGKVDVDRIPSVCDYAVFDQQGNILDGNIRGADAAVAWRAIEDRYASENYYYKVARMENGYCVLRYKLTVQYKSVFMRQHFFEPEILFLLLGIGMMFGIIFFYSIRFGKRIQNKMTPMLEVVEQIKVQELGDEVLFSGIKEIDEIITSMDDMKTALKDSLEMQWKLEQDKNQQMSALAHDIKTPLTIVRGNAELLEETELTDEQKMYISYITDGASQILNYVQTLIEVTKSLQGHEFQKTSVAIEKLLGEIEQQAMGLGKAKHVVINWKASHTSENILASNDLVVRAVVNVIANAVEHSLEGEVVHVEVFEENGLLMFCVEDHGSGFSNEALLHATEQFYMEDASRNSNAHFGIGLYMAKLVAKHHEGDVQLDNSKKTGGAFVTISFSIL